MQTENICMRRTHATQVNACRERSAGAMLETAFKVGSSYESARACLGATSVRSGESFADV
jgi:hypothetical protein